MKRLMYVCLSLSLLFGMFVFSGCNDDDDKILENDLIGRWSLYEFEERLKSGDQWFTTTTSVDHETFLDYYEIEFHKNGEVIFYKPNKTSEEVIFYGSYTVKDEIIIMDMKWSGDSLGSYPFKIIDGNVLTLEHDFDNMIIIEHFRRVK